MNLRERKLALLLLGVLLLIGGGIIAYPTLVVPIRERRERIKTVQDEIAKANETVEKVQRDQARWEKARALSLPADVDTAKVEYVKRIRELLTGAGFAQETAAKMDDAAPAAAVAGPTHRAAKPVLTRLTCTVTGRADLSAVVRFLETFYKMPLLHQVRQLKVERPPTAGTGESKPGELLVNMRLEAVILDSAEDRATLLPHVPPAAAQLGPNATKLAEHLKAKMKDPTFPGKEPPRELAELIQAAAKDAKETVEGVTGKSLFSLLRSLGLPQALGEDKKREALAEALAGLGVKQVPLFGPAADAPPRLATARRDYASIGGLNVFFGPQVERSYSPKSDYDFLMQIILTGVTIEDPPAPGTTGLRATIYDRNRNRTYHLAQTRDGKFKVEDTFLLRGREIKDYKDDLELEDPDTQEKLVYQVIRIDPQGLRDVILRHDGKYLAVYVGHSVREAVPLPDEVLEDLGIVTEKKEKPAEEKKPGVGAKPSSDQKPGDGKPAAPKPGSPAAPPRPVRAAGG